MKLADILARVRYLIDDEKKPYLWSDQELVNYTNDAVDELCERCNLIEDSEDATICQIAVTIGVATYTLDAAIISVVRYKLGNQTQPLAKKSVNYMDQVYIDWENADNGTPIIVIEKGITSGKFRLYPPPDADDTLYATVSRYPKSALKVADITTVEPEIEAKFHRRIPNGIAARAYRKQDAETRDEKKALEHEALFNKDIDEINEIRKDRDHTDETITALGAFR